MILSKCVVGNSKKFKFLKEQGTRGLINAFFKSIKWMQ